MILLSSEILWNNSIWNKAKNLQILKQAGFNTPEFIVLSWETVHDININFSENIKNIMNIINKDFIYNSYSIRSCALIEDLDNSSMAWQFYSEINVNVNEIWDVIHKIIENAKNKLNDLKKLSIIIQEYIPCNISWVTFTRNPNWNRETLVEYHKWEWEDLVSWKIIPKKVSYYASEWNSILENLCNEKIVEKFI